MATRAGTYYTGNLTGNAGSLITALDAVLVTGEGWTKPYTGTNGAHYQQAGGNGFQLFVNDNGTGTGGAREAIWRGCESASAFGTLTDAFPTTALVSDANCVVRKSDTLDATNRPYWAVADDRFIIMVVRFATDSFDCYFFGDIEAFWSGDNYQTFINNRGAANSTTSGLAMQNASQGITATSGSNFWFARTPSGLTKVDRGGVLTIMNANIFGNAAANTIADYPHPQTGKLHLYPALARTNADQGQTGLDGAMLRGAIPYLFEFMHGQGITSLSPLDTFTDSAYDASSQFIIFQETSGTTLATAGDRYVLQTAGTWNPGF